MDYGCISLRKFFKSFISCGECLLDTRIRNTVYIPEFKFRSRLQVVSSALRVVNTWKFDKDQVSCIIKGYVRLNDTQFVNPVFEALKREIYCFISFCTK